MKLTPNYYFWCWLGCATQTRNPQDLLIQKILSYSSAVGLKIFAHFLSSWKKCIILLLPFFLRTIWFFATNVVAHRDRFHLEFLKQNENKSKNLHFVNKSFKYFLSKKWNYDSVWNFYYRTCLKNITEEQPKFYTSVTPQKT